jgi:hypothetical protein
MKPDDPPAADDSLLVSYHAAVAIFGGSASALNEAIASGALKAIQINDRPGSPNLFSRRRCEQLARAQRERRNK